MRDGDKPEKISCILRQDVYNDMVHYGLVAQLGERSVRIREVEGSNPFRSTILRKITANSAVIFRLTTIIPQTAENSDRF